MYLRGGKRLDKRVFLGALFLAQIFLIGVFLAFGSIYSERIPVDTEFDVQFVQSPEKRDNAHQTKISSNDKSTFHQIKVESSDGSFTNEFFHANGANETLCFRDGSVKQAYNDAEQGCQCRAEYHGRDCGQPEVLWRAFMTSKVPLKLTGPRQKPHKLFYLINTTNIAVETIEMQILELINVVDFFIICNQRAGSIGALDNGLDAGSLKNHIQTGVFKEFTRKILVLDIHRCTPKLAYKKFRKMISDRSVSGEDILLYSNIDEILNWRAVKYFKWYDNWPQPVKFRLKYTVYGYFWQHPQNTILGSAACQLNVLDEIYRGDPERMASTRKPGMIVGDLNHAGGWFCQYCYHPVNIVKQLLADGRRDVFLDHKKLIDSAYIETLISNGLFVDGKMGLQRLHRFVDKYYAPDHITNSSWKFENLLTNIYANYDDDYANEM